MAGAPPLNGTSVGFALHDRVKQQTSGEEDRANAGMRLVELAVVSLHMLDEFLQILAGKSFLAAMINRKRGDHTDRLEIDIGP